MVHISLEKAREIGDKLKINFTVISPSIWKKGMVVELEHGKRYKESNITNDDLLVTGKIVLAHLFEYPDYYERLERMEKTAEKYWKGKRKPSVRISTRKTIKK